MTQPATASAYPIGIRIVSTAAPELWSLPINPTYQHPIGPLKTILVPFHETILSKASQWSSDAEWLGVVEQRILSSLAAEGYSLESDVAWLQPDVGQAAVDFFRQTSATLPGEPYIYSAQGGELVAEFSTSDGRLTCIISPTFVLLFAAAKGETMEKRFFPKEQGMDIVRNGVTDVAKFLGTGSHGKVGSTIQR
jgi:hypothetical protein